MPNTPKTFIFNLKRVEHPNITEVKEIRAATMEEAKLKIPQGWIIVTCKESKIH